MRESIVWTWLKNHKPSWLAIERLEVITPPGLSDCFWTDRRTTISGWLELKYCESNDKELRAGRIPKLKPTQPMFLRRQAENGVPCGILLRVGSARWYFWKATPEREWVELVRSTEAISRADVSWTFQPTVAEVMVAVGCHCEG
jgi:hypothetical protein